MAERRMYRPSAAAVPFVVLAWRIAGDKLTAAGSLTADSRRFLDGLALGVAASTLGILTGQRNQDYHSQVAMWTDAAAKRRPMPAPGTISRFRWWMRTAARERSNRSESSLALLHFNLAKALADSGLTERAEAHYRESLRLDPDSALTHNNLGQALARQAKYEEAIAHFQAALVFEPHSALTH